MKTIAHLLPCIALTTGIYLSATAQDLGAYTDYMGRFYIFDKGKSTKIEDLPPQSFKIGGTCVLYVNSQNHLNIYTGGEVKMLEKFSPTEYFAGDFLASYSVFEKLVVIYKGKPELLSTRCTNYFATDSLVAFYDKNEESLKIFYKGKIMDIESGMLGSPVITWSGSDNILAYISDRTNDFNIWYQGEIYQIERNVGNTSFKSGRDVVAFNDEIEQNFKIFYQGEVLTVEGFKVKSFRCGDDFVAYVTQQGEFKIFYNGESTLVSSYPPQSYIAKDNIMAFAQDNRFKAWYNGKISEVEAYMPSMYKLNWNTIAYLDNSNRIWIFQHGERKYFSNELVNSFDIYRDLIIMNVKVNRNIIYYNGSFYEGESFYK